MELGEELDGLMDDDNHWRAGRIRQRVLDELGRVVRSAVVDSSGLSCIRMAVPCARQIGFDTHCGFGEAGASRGPGEVA